MKLIKPILFLVALLLFLFGCIEDGVEKPMENIEKGKAIDESESTYDNLKNLSKEENKGVIYEVEVNSSRRSRTPVLWHYQLTNIDVRELSSLNTSYLVVDPDELSKEEVAELKKKGVKVLAYLSIGEAEDYRDYWKDYWRIGHPSFVVSENPEWKGNYKVEYWNRMWQRIIFGELYKIIELGYDGVYLDVVDAYEFFERRDDVDPKKEMIEFVKRISERAKSKNPSFLIIPQNAVELYEDKGYKEAIDGVGKEDTWYWEKGELNREGLEYLKRVKEDGKLVFAVDYPSKEHVCSFYEECSSYGFYCVAQNRKLNSLFIPAC